MSAPKGNEFWKLRAKHGRDAIFASPEQMLESAYEYFDYQSKQKWHKNEAIKSGDYAGTIVKIPTESPFTWEGLCIYLGVNTVYFNHFQKECSEDFSKVITHIGDIIRKQKFEGAAVGAFNANIIARDLGLRDNQDVTTGGEKIDYEGFRVQFLDMLKKNDSTE